MTVDKHLMESLSSSTNPNPVFEIIADNYSKNDMLGLVRFLSLSEVAKLCGGVSFKDSTREKSAKSSSCAPVFATKSKSSSKSKTPPQTQTQAPTKKANSQNQSFSLKDRPPAEFIRSLAKLLMRAPNLKVLLISNINLNKKDSQLLSKGLRANNNCKLSRLVSFRLR